MPIFIEMKGTRYEVLAPLHDNNYLVREVDKSGRKILTNTGKIIHYEVGVVARIINWLFDNVNHWS